MYNQVFIIKSLAMFSLQMPSNELYAYSHCKKGALQICHNEVPNDCTICGNVIDSFLVPPYTLKTPLSTSVPHSVMLRSADRSLDGYVFSLFCFYSN